MFAHTFHVYFIGYGTQRVKGHARIEFEPVHEISNNVVCATSKVSYQPSHTRSFDQSLCLSLEYPMIVKLLTEHHLRFLSLKVGCTGSSESTLVKMPLCSKSHALAQFESEMHKSNIPKVTVNMHYIKY